LQILNNILSFIYLWKPLVEILILWLVIYHIMLFFEGTRAIQVLRGIVILIIAFFLFQKLNLEILNWIFTKLFAISVIAVLVIFHPEIRNGLAHLGKRLGTPLREEELDYMVKEIAKAADNLSKDKLGALIAIEKNDPLTSYIESGVKVDARVSAELIQAIFTPNNPLHDGAMVIQHGRIAAAGCLFPLMQGTELSRIFGTRHRAALGLSEETDALLIIVSEERRDISLVYHSKLYKDLSRELLLDEVKKILILKIEDD
jgi:diadenylate cyclase